VSAGRIEGDDRRQLRTAALFTEGTLVVDIVNAADVLVWRGTTRNREQSGPTLSRKLSGDARNLLSKFPPRTK
jgi:hypothetical protein